MSDKKTILFVEDDPVDRKSLERILKDNAEYDYVMAENFSRAIEAIENNPIDVVVCDYHLGDGTGIDLIQKYPDLPVVIITGTSDIELSVKAMKLGAYDFLVKDVDSAYLKMITIACQQAISRKNSELHIQKLTQAVEQNPSLVLISDVDGVIEYVNPKYTELTGYTTDELIGQHTRIFKSGHHDNTFYHQLWEKIKSGEKWTGELYNKTKHDTYYWEFTSIAPLTNKSGNITHFIKVGENMTDLKKAEQERIEAGRLQGVLEIAGTISHEFNQPLQIILGYSELLKDKMSNDPTLEKQFQNIIANINRMLETSEKLKKITRYKTLPYLDKNVIIDIHDNEGGDE